MSKQSSIKTSDLINYVKSFSSKKTAFCVVLFITILYLISFPANVLSNSNWTSYDEIIYKDPYGKYHGFQSKKFMLYRTIGNDLPPRHEIGQSYENVKFILENEEDHPELSKGWILNRIVNKTEERRIEDLLIQHNQIYHILTCKYYF